jgi:hypothetical protein
VNARKVYYLLLGSLVLGVIIAIATVVLGNAMLKKQAQSLLDIKLQNRVLDEQQTALKQAGKDIDKYAELEKTAKQIVPQDKDQAKTVREIVKIADSTGISIGNITFPSSTLGTTVPKSTGGTNSISSGVSQLKPVPGITGLYQMEITLQSDNTKPVTYAALINFLSKLEQNRHTAQVSMINIQPFPTNIKFLTFSTTINVYIKP